MDRFTADKLQKIFPTTPGTTISAWVSPLNLACSNYDISTPARAAAWIAQVGHESAGLTTIRENLNYSQSGLRTTFAKYFPSDALAGKYARNPQMIASRVYANRGGNGDEASQDGWTFRGRGGIQITFRNNYTAFAADMKMDLTKVTAYMETFEGAAMSAAWFWTTNGLNTLADQGRFGDITKKINGGTTGAADRNALWALARSVI